MVKKITLGTCHLTLVFRHRWEKEKYSYRTFRRWELGLWFKKTKMVGIHNVQHPATWSQHLVNSYMLGVEFLIGRAWVSWDWGGMHFEVKPRDYNI